MDEPVFCEHNDLPNLCGLCQVRIVESERDALRAEVEKLKVHTHNSMCEGCVKFCQGLYDQMHKLQAELSEARQAMERMREIAIAAQAMKKFYIEEWHSLVGTKDLEKALALWDMSRSDPGEAMKFLEEYATEREKPLREALERIRDGTQPPNPAILLSYEVFEIADKALEGK